MRKFLLLMVMLGGLVAFMPDVSWADAKLPSYASGGSVDAKAQSVGKKVTDVVALIVGILAILGMFAGAGFFALGRKDNGWQFLGGGVIALLLSGSVYGIATLVV